LCISLTTFSRDESLSVTAGLFDDEFSFNFGADYLNLIDCLVNFFFLSVESLDLIDSEP